MVVPVRFRPGAQKKTFFNIHEGGKSKILDAGLAVTDNDTDGCFIIRGTLKKIHFCVNKGPIAQLDRATAF